MNILFLSAEFGPLVKVGGLADVAYELPLKLREQGMDVRLVFPFYPMLDRSKLNAEPVQSVEVDRQGKPVQAQIYQTELDGIPIYLIDGEPIQCSPDAYPGQPLESERFIFFSLAALAFIRASGWVPDIMHANDWHTSTAVVALRKARSRDGFWKNTGSLLTIHNLPYMGAGGEEVVRSYGLNDAENELIPEWGRAYPLPLGMVAADYLNTVSPTYAQEIQTRAYGAGLEGVLRARKANLAGILNGIAPEVWDPASDSQIGFNFSVSEPDGKRENKKALQQELDLPVSAEIPLIGMVTRLDYQKGVDLALEALAGLQGYPWQFVLLGSGDPELEQQARSFASEQPHRSAIRILYDGKLARRIYAGCDMFLIPSRYEPCGLTQMIAMRYGTIPVVRATGGLRDTVISYTDPESGNGFIFTEENSTALQKALCDALSFYTDKSGWSQLQMRAMQSDFSWNQAARQYADLYRKILSESAAW